MKSISLFSLILKQTRTGKFLLSFAAVFVLCTLAMWMLDPSIKTLGDAIWFGFMLVTTTGFGDLTVTTPAARIVAAILGLYGVLTIGFICGVGTSWLFEKFRAGRNDSVSMMLYQLEHLDTLSDEQITALKSNIARVQNQNASLTAPEMKTEPEEPDQSRIEN